MKKILATKGSDVSVEVMAWLTDGDKRSGKATLKVQQTVPRTGYPHSFAYSTRQEEYSTVLMFWLFYAAFLVYTLSKALCRGLS